jgi:hypothetical protein
MPPPFPGMGRAARSASSRCGPNLAAKDSEGCGISAEVVMMSEKQAFVVSSLRHFIPVELVADVRIDARSWNR